MELSYEEAYIKGIEILTPYLNDTHEKSKYWIVFDIDHTLLSDSNVKHLYSHKSDVFKYINKGIFIGIDPMIKLYNWCIINGFSVCLLTGRMRYQERATIKNLSNVGIRKCNRLYMRSGKINTVTYKSSSRREIEQSGDIILLNIGDQPADLEGGYSRSCIKLPSHY